MSLRRRRWPVVAAALLAAALVLLASGRGWADGRVAGLSGVVRVSVTGRQAQSLVPALGLIVAVAGVVLAICGPLVRWLAAAALVLAGAGTAGTALVRGGDPAALLATAAARATGVSGGPVQAATLSGWPAVAAAGGVLAVLAGLAVLPAGAAWAAEPARSRRYRRAGEGDPGGPGGPGDPGEAAEAGEAAGPVTPAEDPAAAWDALSRGDDPTARPG